MSASAAPVRFFAEQSRIRAQTWRVTAAAVLLAICLGLLASAGLAPILLAVAAILIRLADLMTGGAFEPVRQGLSQFIATAFADLDTLLNNSQSFIEAVSPQSLAGLWRFGVLMLPGFALTGLSYFWLLKRISSRSDDALATALQTRPARPAVEGESETLRITQELCIMAGIAVPEVLVTEHAVPNLAICGKDYTSWTLVATSGFASGLDRHEKRGAIACAVARISDGDLDVNAAVSALGSITGLMSSLLDWPVSRAARRRLALVTREVFSGSGNPAAIEQRLHGAVDERLDEVNAIDQDSLTWLQKARGYLLAPFHIISFAFTMLASLWSRILVAGVIGFMLRRRCFKGDAAAARLIGDADLVAKGVSRFQGLAVFLPAGPSGRRSSSRPAA